MNITIEELKNKIHKLNGMFISLPWKGYGSAIFIELKSFPDDNKTEHGKGEISIWLEWDWRVEKNGKILFGSSNSRPEIIKGIKDFNGRRIDNIEVNGDIPELSIYLSGGYKIQSMAMVTGNPQWTIQQKDSTYLSWKDFNAVESNGAINEITIEERNYQHFIEEISDKLGRPIIEPAAGECRNCKYFFPIDGDFDLLDYGVCLNDKCKLFQQVVKIDSGCPEFLKDE